MAGAGHRPCTPPVGAPGRWPDPTGRAEPTPGRTPAPGRPLHGRWTPSVGAPRPRHGLGRRLAWIVPRDGRYPAMPYGGP